jgi:hypothetical protein
MPKPAYLAYGRTTGHVGQILTLSALTNEEGVATVNVTGTFVGQPGAYILFAQLEGVEPATLMIYEASTDEGEQH